MSRTFRLLSIGLLLALAPAIVWAQPKTRNVILITLDGVRIQEMFGGLDVEILRSTVRREPLEENELYRQYWAPTPEERRQKLMPFFWGTLMTEHGSIGGNRALGSTVAITNRHRFSYPGYAEILVGEAHDAEIDSNEPRRNPNPTVLEVLRNELKLDAREVAAFGSWRVFNWIVAHEEDAVTVNAGYEPYEHQDPRVQQLSRLQFETPTPWDSVRHDLYTFRFAMTHLATWRPRVLYLALGETDDWAHDGRYDRVIQTLARTDRYLEELWTWLQSDDQYRDKTTILITTDHGRGNTVADWRSHGAKIDGAQYTWLAAMGPDFEKRGEWRAAPTICANQVAATLVAVLGLDYARSHPSAGKPIGLLFEAR
jgi:hypothetical protein